MLNAIIHHSVTDHRQSRLSGKRKPDTPLLFSSCTAASALATSCSTKRSFSSSPFSPTMGMLGLSRTATGKTSQWACSGCHQLRLLSHANKPCKHFLYLFICSSVTGKASCQPQQRRGARHQDELVGRPLHLLRVSSCRFSVQSPKRCVCLKGPRVAKFLGFRVWVWCWRSLVLKNLGIEEPLY